MVYDAARRLVYSYDDDDDADDKEDGVRKAG